MIAKTRSNERDYEVAQKQTGGERRFFEPSRAGGFAGWEKIDLDRGTFVTLTLTGQF